ncbi:MAG: protein arginine kinase [Clostridia bacterium]|nr:protein arginine kinase [Clostridia bacterium]
MTSGNKWYQLSGAQADVVISTRVRLARNLREYPFPGVMTDEQRAAVNKLVRDAVIDGGSALSGRFSYIELGKLSVNERVSMVERHLISPEFARKPEGRAMLLMDDESVSIMICEEDHIRIQVMSQGLELGKVYDMADKIDTLLSERLSFAVDEKLGYLTSCPTNLGTAMRASVMLHLPAIEASGILRGLGGNIAKLGMAIRGMYGEGSGSRGAIYQISNQETLGVSEQGTIEKLDKVIGQILELERKERGKISGSDAQSDRIWRAWGILRSARMISSDEFVELYSAVRMGVSMGLLSGVTLDKLNSLFVRVQPATMICESGKQLDAAQRDAMRAQLVRECIG